MRHFLFYEKNTGEDFIVGAYSKREAWDIAKEVADNIHEYSGMATILSYGGEITDDEAEASGLDEY